MSQVPPISPSSRPTNPTMPGGASRTSAATVPGGHSMSPSASGPEIGIFDLSQRTPLMVLGGLLLLLVVAYWDMFALISAAWKEDLYSHGWLVPIFALGLLWLRWEPFRPVPTSERYLGVLLLGIGLSIRLLAAEYTILPVDRLSFIVSIFGVFMLVGGAHAIRWAWPGLIFLLFMFPLPTALELNVLNRLQRMATVSSTFVLQTIGVAAIRTGNLIQIPGMGQPLNVAEACSGLRMTTIFGALAVGMVFVIDRPWWDKLVILISAAPIAIIVNIVRITVTALLYLLVGPENSAVQKICHDWAGLVIMMPLALLLLWLELQILERVTIPVDTVQLRPVGGMRTVGTLPTR